MGEDRPDRRTQGGLQLAKTGPAANDQANFRANFYGRRVGHPLRPGPRKLIDELLPRVSVVLPRGAADAPDRLIDPFTLFPAGITEIWLEVGFGRGEHLAWQARANPHVGIIGCEPFINGVAGLLQKIEQEGLSNVRIFNDDARLLMAALPEASLSRFFLLFPDPWPKTRHNKRRFVSDENIAGVARLLKDGAEFRYATDHMDYCRWTLARMMACPDFEWAAERPGDWRTRPEDWPPTRYETKAAARGLKSAYLTFCRIPPKSPKSGS